MGYSGNTNTFDYRNFSTRVRIGRQFGRVDFSIVYRVRVTGRLCPKRNVAGNVHEASLRFVTSVTYASTSEWKRVDKSAPVNGYGLSSCFVAGVEFCRGCDRNW